MSYRIEYKHEKKYKTKPKIQPWLKVTAIALIIAIGIYSLQFIPWESLLPGNPKVTGEALDRLVSNLSCGEPITEVFSTFCEEIVAHANLPK